MRDYLDCLVVGAGVVGLAVARELALAGRDVFIVEQHDLIGSETSSRNSEVIHAGIYYPAGSLKAKYCVAGKWMLYDYCRERDIIHKNCGKLIVATSAAELPILDDLQAKAAANGVDDLTRLSAAEALALEPDLQCEGALLSPSTGIIDSHSLMFGYQTDAENAGAILALKNRVTGLSVEQSGFGVEIEDESGHRETVYCHNLINSAGIWAPQLSQMMVGFPQENSATAYYCKGNYFGLSGRQPFSRLIYPVPEAAGLGVHVTLDTGGQIRFGPDTEWVDEVNYDVDPSRADVFYAAIRKYYPALEDGQLTPAYSGIRPKIAPAGATAPDFVIQGPQDHGLRGLVNLFGIESPGLTSSLAIAKDVGALILASD